MNRYILLTLFVGSIAIFEMRSDVLSAAPSVCTTRPDHPVQQLPPKPETAWNTARMNGGCALYQDKKTKIGGVPQRHLFVYLPAGYDPNLMIPNGLAPAGPTYSFATDAFGTFRYDPVAKGNVFTAAIVPPIWQIWPGDVLHVRLITCVALSALAPPAGHANGGVTYPQDGAATSSRGRDACPAASAPANPNYFITNLHTHGLIVTPRNSIRGAALKDRQDGTGDNIFVAVPYGKKFDYTITVPPDHPTGLYWYHPHIHGVSARQVTGGMAGLIAVGEPVDLLRSPGDETSSASTAQREFQASERADSDIRFVILKDTQIVTTSKPENGTNTIIGKRLSPVDAGLCADPDHSRVRNSPRDTQGICWIDYPKYGYPVWLFTVNGERYPTFAARPQKKSFIFRISNQSASVTYDLQIIDRTVGSDNKAVSFDLLTIDGVVAGATAPGSAPNRSVAPTSVKHILMMPAARAEIRLQIPSAGKQYELVANNGLADANNNPVGLVTGPGVYGANGGDSWPYVALASIVGSETAPPPPQPIRLLDPAVAQSQPFNKLQAPFALTLAPPKDSGCVGNFRLHAAARRVVILTTDSTGMIFQMGYTEGNSASEKPPIIAPRDFPHPIIWRDITINGKDYRATEHVCVAFDEEEIWEIRNLTSELHNFHIHQAKFQMATKDEIIAVTQNDILQGVVPAGLPISSNPVECYGTPGAPCWADPNNFMSVAVYDNISTLNGAQVMHDTFPVPPALTDLTDPSNITSNPLVPGRVFLKLTFHKKEQVGRYVYHCHILEHEDGGMMAPIEVIDTRGVSAEAPSSRRADSGSNRFLALLGLMTKSEPSIDPGLDVALASSICMSGTP